MFSSIYNDNNDKKERKKKKTFFSNNVCVICVKIKLGPNLALLVWSFQTTYLVKFFKSYTNQHPVLQLWQL